MRTREQSEYPIRGCSCSPKMFACFRSSGGGCNKQRSRHCRADKSRRAKSCAPGVAATCCGKMAERSDRKKETIANLLTTKVKSAIFPIFPIFPHQRHV